MGEFMALAEPAFPWNLLLTCMDERSVIPIVGRELLTVSVEGREVLLDRYLAERLAAELGVGVEAFGNGPGLDAVATAYLGQGGDSRKIRDIYTTLLSIMGEREFPTPPSLAKLAEITDFRLFVTTTFDSLLCQALNEQRPGGLSPEHCLVYAPGKNPTDRDYDLPPEWKKRDGAYVHYLFGRLSTIPGDYAVTEEDYLEFISTLQSEERRPANLFHEFKTNNLLFLGCGFENWLERFFIRTVRGERFSLPYGPTQIVADREAGRGGNLTVFLQLYQMRVFREGDPVQFVDELHRRWRERHPKTAEPKIDHPVPKMETGAVFLSYASEDLPAARRLHDALRQAGMDVWFDKAPGTLPPGVPWESMVQTGIERCAVFVPLLSRRAQQDTESYFRKEWDLAIERSKGIDEETTPFILPVVLAENPPDRHEPGIRKEFWQHQCWDLPEGRPTAEFIDYVKEQVKRRRKREGGY